MEKSLDVRDSEYLMSQQQRVMSQMEAERKKVGLAYFYVRNVEKCSRITEILERQLQYVAVLIYNDKINF